MSAQPDPALEPVLAEPIRLALWRESTNGKGAGLVPIADAFLPAGIGGGGTFTSQSVAQLMHALTATQGALGVLPRWVAEAFADVLHLDPSDLRPERRGGTLRAVPHSERKPLCPTPKPSHPSASRSSATPAGKVSVTNATEGTASATTRFTTKFQVVTNPQGIRDESPSAGVADSMVPPAVAPPASPASNWRRFHRCDVESAELFFPGRGGSLKAANDICASCPVRAQCLREALRVPQTVGTWGGTNERQRRTLKHHQDLPDAELLALADSLPTVPVAKPPAPNRPRPALVVPEGYKRCLDQSCRTVLALETGFYRDKNRPDGHAIYCKACAGRKAKEVKARRSPEAQAAVRERNRIAQQARYRARRTA